MKGALPLRKLGVEGLMLAARTRTVQEPRSERSGIGTDGRVSRRGDVASITVRALVNLGTDMMVRLLG